MTREIVLDTETTGLDPLKGDRLVEIGALELIDHLPTGQHRHFYLHPERDMPEEAFRIHGLSSAFLADKPRFAAIVDDLLEFIADSPLVIHNARFDMGFLNAELARCGRVAIPHSRAVDTLTLAQRRFPGAPASLDALCRRFGVDNANRTLHGALLDSELLAEVYLHLMGGRQARLVLAAPVPVVADIAVAAVTIRPPRPHAPSAAELEAHAAFLARIENPIWLD